MRKILVLAAACLLALAGCSAGEPAAGSDVVSEAQGGVIIQGYVTASERRAYYSYSPGKIKLVACDLGDTVLKDTVVVTYTDEADPLNAKHLEITAEYDNSVVSELYVEPDQAIGAGTLIGVISDGSSIIARADVLENLIKNLSVGQAVTMTLKADRSRSYPGRVTKIEGVAREKDNGDVVIGAEFAFENLDDAVKIGYGVEIKVEV